MNISSCMEEMDDHLTVGLDIAALVLQLVTGAVGTLGSALSLFCLLSCQRIQTGMKIQLGLFFSIILLVSLVGMPSAAIVEFGSLRCWQQNPSVKITFVAIYTIGVALERNIFAVMAIYRLLAVCSPEKYKTLSRWGIVVAVEVVLCVGVIAVWLPTFVLQDIRKADVNNPTSSSAGYALYLVIFLLPIFVSVFAYFVLFVVMLFRKKKKEQLSGGRRARTNDQINFALGILILANLLLDVPHITVHLIGALSWHLSFILIHIVYRLHLALDPFIFIALNSHYRRRVLRLLFSRVCSERYAEASTTCESTTRRPDSLVPKGHPAFSTTVLGPGALRGCTVIG